MTASCKAQRHGLCQHCRYDGIGLQPSAGNGCAEEFNFDRLVKILSLAGALHARQGPQQTAKCYASTSYDTVMCC